jgi:hypothetical protein
MEKEPSDPEPVTSRPQTYVTVEDDEMTVDNPLSLTYEARNPPTIIQASPTALHLKVSIEVRLIKFYNDKVYKWFFYICLSIGVSAITEVTSIFKLYSFEFVMHREYCDITPESRSSSLLCDGSVNTFWRKQTRACI